MLAAEEERYVMEQLRTCAAVAACVVALAGANASATTALPVRTIALSGTQVDGFAPGVLYSTFADPTINDAGDVAFRVSLTGTGISGTNNSAVLRTVGSGFSLLAQEGAQVPGMALGVNYQNFTSAPRLNSAGNVVFSALVNGTGIAATNNAVILTDAGGGGLVPVAQKGTQPPGLPAGLIFSVLNPPSINSAGQIAFRGAFTGPGINATNGSAIFSDIGGAGFDVIVRAGTQAGGLPAGVNYGSISIPAFNDDGHMAFRNTITGTGVDSTNNGVIFSSAAGSGFEPVAREGDQAPGLAAGVTYGIFSSFPALNNANKIAFRASVSGPGIDTTNNSAIFTDAGGPAISAIVQTGDQAAGLPVGAVYTSFSQAVLSDGGQTAFWASLGGTGIDSTNNAGLFATNPLGELVLVAARGSMLNVSTDPLIDDFRTISNITSSQFDWNASGELVYTAFFTDGSSGVFVATVPAPGAACLILATGLVCSGRRRSA